MPLGLMIIILLISGIATANDARDEALAMMADGRFSDAARAFSSIVEDQTEGEALAQALLDLGAAQIQAMDDAAAAESFEAAFAVASQHQLPDLALRAEQNRLRLSVLTLDFEPTLNTLSQHVDDITAGPGNQLDLLIGAMGLGLEFEGAFFQEAAIDDALLKAGREALRQIEDESTRAVQASYVNGLLGTLYERRDQVSDARVLTARALELARDAQDPGAIFRWEWQSARLAARARTPDVARSAYRRAIQALGEVRRTTPPGYRDFYTRWIAPLYREYANLVLMEADRSDQPQDLLLEARTTLEQVKQAEVENYLARECVIESAQPDASAGGTTAIVYPVKLLDRIVILLEAGGQLHSFVTPVEQRAWLRTIRGLRRKLEQPGSGDSYLAEAQRLYDWIIRPVLSVLNDNGIDTLVTLPEGALRTLPLGVLHDGQSFLIERFSLSTTPALSLTSRGTGASTDRKTLAGGVTEAVDGFDALPEVRREMDMLAKRTNSKPFVNADFLQQSIAAQVAETDYAIAHFATHGKFEADSESSFILMYDRRWRLSEIRETLLDREARLGTSLDLLVLSACETAAGDDQAALGLAGAAVQAGTRSVLASLWSVSDVATATLMDAFYDQLINAGRSKAASLQIAQRSLLKQERFKHPAYWAPYLLVGDWQ